MRVIVRLRESRVPRNLRVLGREERVIGRDELKSDLSSDHAHGICQTCIDKRISSGDLSSQLCTKSADRHTTSFANLYQTPKAISHLIYLQIVSLLRLRNTEGECGDRSGVGCVMIEECHAALRLPRMMKIA